LKATEHATFVTYDTAGYGGNSDSCPGEEEDEWEVV